jgi:hypothetical protein
MGRSRTTPLATTERHGTPGEGGDQRLRFLAIRQLGSTEGFGGSDSGFGSGFGSSFSMISRTTRSLGDIGQRSSANLRRA